MTATTVNAAADYEDMLEHGTKHAQSLLDKLQFTEARSAYHEVLRQATRDLPGSARGIQCGPGPAERATVAAVSGLAESFARQSRNCSSDNDHHASLSWLRLNIQVWY